MQIQPAKALDASEDCYREVLSTSLVPMTLRVGFYNFNSCPMLSNSGYSEEKGSSQLAIPLTSLLPEIAHHVVSLSQSSIAKNIYAKAQPVIRLVSNEFRDMISIENVDTETLLLAPLENSNGPKLSNNTITYSTDIISCEKDEFFWLRQICNHSNLVIVSCKFSSSEISDKESDFHKMLNAVFQVNPTISVLVDNEGEFCFYNKESCRNNQKLNSQEFATQLEIGLSEILLFDSLLLKSNESKKATPYHSAVQRIIDYNKESSLVYQKLEADFENQGPIGSLTPWLSWRNVFKRFISLFSPKTEHHKSSLENNESFVSLQRNSQNCQTLFAHFLKADQLAISYANAHRSSFILIYCLGAFALINAAIAIGYSYIGWLALTSALCEFVALIGIFFLYRNDHKKSYHIKWLEYRSLAEMLRTSPLLNCLGVMPSARGVEHHRHEAEITSEKSAGRVWLIIYIETLMRWIGNSHLEINQQKLLSAKRFLKETVLKNQIEYHKQNAHKMHIIGHNLGHFSYVLFILAFIFVSGKLITKLLAAMNLGIDYQTLSQVGHGLGFLAAICPMIGSAAFAIRNHAEFDISSQRSLGTLKRLTQSVANLDRMQSPLSYSELVGQSNDASLIMQSETADWLEIYAVKETEPG